MIAIEADLISFACLDVSSTIHVLLLLNEKSTCEHILSWPGVRRSKVADRLGQQFGNYRLVSLLGQGGYAEVYLGQHVRFNQQAAIKVLHAHLSGVEAEHFQQEAETIATLAHPSIIRILDFDVQEGVPFLVIDYASGGTLRRRYP